MKYKVIFHNLLLKVGLQNMTSFGERLRELRLEKNMYQEDFGKHFSLSRRQIYRYESGENEASIQMLIELADFFGVSVDYLIGHTDVREPYPAPDDKSTTSNKNESNK